MSFAAYYRGVFFFVLIIVQQSWGMECTVEKRKSNEFSVFARNLLVGGIAGNIETLLGHPLLVIKNKLQLNQKIKLNCSQMYRGVGINMCCKGPTIGVQVAANKALEKVIPGDDIKHTISRSGFAGALSTIVSSPAEFWMLIVQNNRQKARDTLRMMFEDAGVRVLSRGIVPKTLRNSCYAVSFLSLYPWCENTLNSTLSAGIVSGVIGALFTHPLDIVATTLQADYKKEHVRTMRDALIQIYDQQGAKGFFKGIAPRCLRMAFALPIMNGVQKKLYNFLATHEQCQLT